MKLERIAAIAVIGFILVLTLIYGRHLITPFVISVLIWLLVREMVKFIDRVKLIKQRIPQWTKTTFVSIFILTALFFTGKLLSNNIDTITESYDTHQGNFVVILEKFESGVGVNLNEFVKSHADDINLGGVLGGVLSSVRYLVGSTFMILIYAIFVFLEEAVFQTKLKGITKYDSRYHRTVDILAEIESSVTKYIGLKTFVSVLTAGLSYIALLIIGVESPFFWSFVIFLLNFIPNIGSFIGTIFPSIYAMLQFGTFSAFFLVLGVVGLIQLIVGNVVEPKITGDTLNISPLVTILALAFWGAIWGVTGMFLSVPITVIIIIVCSHFESTRPIAIILSEKGETGSK